MKNITNDELYKIKLQEDIDFGIDGENGIKTTIENLLLTTITKTDNKFDVMDYIDSDGDYYEIKTRRNTHNKYPTTMVGENKIKFCKTSDKICLFFFRFTDGDYYWPFNNNDFLLFSNGGRNDRGCDEYKKYCYIPIRYLKKVPTDLDKYKKG
jgi:hypothetical protein